MGVCKVFKELAFIEVPTVLKTVHLKVLAPTLVTTFYCGKSIIYGNRRLRF